VSELPPPQQVAEVQAAIDEIVSGDAHQLVGAYYRTEAGAFCSPSWFLSPCPLEGRTAPRLLRLAGAGPIDPHPVAAPRVHTSCRPHAAEAAVYPPQQST
jgi:hypothetical protein